MEINGVPISNKNPEIVLKLFFASLISVVIFDILVVLAEDVFFNPFILVLLFVVGTINVIIITILAKFPQVSDAIITMGFYVFWKDVNTKNKMQKCTANLFAFKNIIHLGFSHSKYLRYNFGSNC